MRHICVSLQEFGIPKRSGNLEFGERSMEDHKKIVTRKGRDRGFLAACLCSVCLKIVLFLPCGHNYIFPFAACIAFLKTLVVSDFLKIKAIREHACGRLELELEKVELIPPRPTCWGHSRAGSFFFLGLKCAHLFRHCRD